MKYLKSQLSEKRVAINKGIAELFNLLGEIDSDPSSDGTYTDEDGNTIKLSADAIGDNGEYGMVTIEIKQKDSTIIINLAEPTKQLLSEIKTRNLLNGNVKKK